MANTDLVLNAMLFAAAAHGAINQRRKYTFEPYAEHAFSVALKVEHFMSDNPEVIAAAALHDVVEDTAIGIDTIEHYFGAVVARLVSEVTDVSRMEDGNRAVRKAIDRAHLAKASPEGKSIKLADLWDNTSNIVQHDVAFAKIYLPEKRLLLPLLREGNPGLYRKAEQALISAEKVIGL